MTIQELQKLAWANSEEKGFHSSPELLNIPTKLMLVVSELAEALEEYRVVDDLKAMTVAPNGKPEGFMFEIADAVIRIADLAQMVGVDLESAIKIKMKYNNTRLYKHGGKRI